MISTLIQASRIKRTYNINSIVYRLKTIPLIGKLIPYSEYAGGPIKTIAFLIEIVKSMFSFCILEVIYFLLMMGMAGAFTNIFDKTEITIGALFLNIFFFLMLIDLPLNNILLDPSKDKYYAIILIRMNARKYILSDMYYKLFRKLVGYYIMSIPVCFIFEINPLIMLFLTVTTISGKFLGAFIKLQFAKRDKIGRHSLINFFWILLVIATVIYLLWAGLFVTLPVIYMVGTVITLLGLFSFYKLFTFKDYSLVCKSFLKEEVVFAVKNTKENQTKFEKKAAVDALSLDEKEEKTVSDKSGYEFFNEIFVKRHSKILRKRSQLISVITIIATLLIYGIILYWGDIWEPICRLEIVLLSLPMLFYFLNTGESLTASMYLNCDEAMLTYNFYRKANIILGVFKQRLITTIKLNIVPAVIIAGGLAFLGKYLFIDISFVDYVAIFIICPSLSMFFSVHRLIIYYLLQPYIVGLDKKKVSYKFANTATYVVSYMAMINSNLFNVRPIAVAITIVVFSVIYIIVSLSLVYKYAPKRFKLNR